MADLSGTVLLVVSDEYTRLALARLVASNPKVTVVSVFNMAGRRAGTVIDLTVPQNAENTDHHQNNCRQALPMKVEPGGRLIMRGAHG